jgi:hypothetical protein
MFAGSTQQQSITTSQGSTAFTGTIQGTLAGDEITVTSGSTTQTGITLSGDLSIGTNKLVVTDILAGSTAQNINISGLKNYGSSTITTTNASDTIVGGGNDDIIIASGGTNTLTGGAGKDTFLFNLGDSTINSVNTITDFSNTDGDRIVFGAVDIVLMKSDAATTTMTHTSSTTTNSISGGIVTVNNLGVATFSGTATAIASLAQKAALISESNFHTSSNGAKTTADISAGDAVLFQDSGNTYLYVDGGAGLTNDMVIKLVGVALPSATIPTIGTGTATGIYGIGL